MILLIVVGVLHMQIYVFWDDRTKTNVSQVCGIKPYSYQSMRNYKFHQAQCYFSNVSLIYNEKQSNI